MLGRGKYTSYNFIDKDPIIDEVRTAIDKANVTDSYVCNKSGVCKTTLRSWFAGHTKRPQAATVRAVLRSIGYDIKVVRISK